MNLIVCDECGKEFLVNAVKIECCDKVVNKKHYKVSYFRCLKCRRPYIIQIRDDRADELISDFKNQNARWQKIMSRNKPEEIAGKQNIYVSLLAKQKRMKEYLEKLMKRYKEQITVDLMPNNQDV